MRPLTHPPLPRARSRPRSHPPYTAPSWGGYGQLTSALVQVYDLVASIEPDQALPYLSRLGAIASALLANRDDKTGLSTGSVARSRDEGVGLANI